jgi:hypothetical protein
MRIPIVVAIATLALSCDPVKSDAVSALGDEAPGVRTGPEHRPGQPCIVCHDGSFRSPTAFTVAGTIFQDQNDLRAASGAEVTITGADGKYVTQRANSAGNFYFTEREYTPVYPLSVSITYRNFPAVKMTSLVGGNGSCATCHTDPAGPTSAGHIFIPSDGKTP